MMMMLRTTKYLVRYAVICLMYPQYLSYNLMYCRGPLPDGHPKADVTYFGVDHDVATGACNLTFAPPIQPIRHIDGPCVLLDAHRAPDEWFGIACTMPHLIIQGDPDAHRPRTCTVFAAELSKSAAPARSQHVNLGYASRLADAIPMIRGKYIVLVGSRDSVDSVYNHLRPDGVQIGDIVQDMYGRSGIVDSTSVCHLFVDDGRRAITRSTARQQLVLSPGGVRAGEYDTVIVLPGVAEPLARAVCTRCRYMIIAIRHSPMGYCQ